MRIITLNTWGGRGGKEKLLEFFKQYKDTTDVFCLQEMWAAPHAHLEGYNAGGVAINHEDIMVHGFQELSALLENHTAYFRPHYFDHYGLVMFVNKNLQVEEEGEVFVHKEKGYIPEGDVGKHARNIQFAKIKTAAGFTTVINFHGLWNGQGKGDSDDRLEQSENILKYIKDIDGEVVLCGDFNLLPETKSLQMFETLGLRNLIKENSITSTRTSMYKKPERYADYVFTSPALIVKDFKVLPEEVSDHCALLVDVE